ncbi:hypothetical protein N9J02_00270 [bacterium]|jgi:hypothetical protein|nr:hypothetical protein [bacterium]
MTEERREKNDAQKEHEKKVFNDDLNLTPDEEELLKKKLEELRKRDPFVYR